MNILEDLFDNDQITEVAILKQLVWQDSNNVYYIWIFKESNKILHFLVYGILIDGFTFLYKNSNKH